MNADHPVGEIYRLMAVARGCRGDLTNNEEIVQACHHAVDVNGLSVVSQAVHAFVPHGLSIALLLAQSHMAVSTWPEYRLATVDLAVCAAGWKAQAIWEELRFCLDPASVELSEGSVALRAPGTPDLLGREPFSPEGDPRTPSQP